MAEGKTTIFKREWRTFDGEIASRRKNFVLTARAFGVRFIGKHATSARGQSLLPVTALYGHCTALHGIETGFWLTSGERMSDTRLSEFFAMVE